MNRNSFCPAPYTWLVPSSFGLKSKGMYLKDNVTIKTPIRKNTPFLVENWSS